MSRDRWKVSKHQQKGHIGQGKLPGVSQSYVLDCYTKSKKFSVEFFFFLINFNGRLFFSNFEYRVCSRQVCLHNVPVISLMRKRIEREEGVSEIGDIEQLRTVFSSQLL